MADAGVLHQGDLIANPRLDRGIVTRLRRLSAKLRRYVLIEGIAWVVAFLAACFTLQVLLDYSTHGLRWSMRAVLLAVVALGGLWVLFRRLFEPLRIPRGLPDIANLVERRFPQLRTSLISAVRFAEQRTAGESHSPTLVSSVVHQAGRSLADVPVESIINPRRARAAGFALVGVLLAVVLAALIVPQIVRLGFERNVLLRNTPWPKQTRLIVDLTNGELIGARGDDVIVQARAEGRQPREVEIVFDTVSGQRGRETMATVGSQGSYHYRYTFKNAQEDLDFQLRGGDDRTDDFRLRLLDRPAIEASEMWITPPAYTRLAPVHFGDGQRAAQVLPGSQASLWVKTNKPIAQATLMAGDQPIGEAVKDQARYRVEFTPTETRTYRFRLLDEFKLENRQLTTFALRVVKDEPPTVRMKLNGVGDMITPDAILPIEVEYADGYGLARAELQYGLSRDEGKINRIDLPDFTPETKTYSQRLEWKLAGAGAVAGETLSLAAEGADFDDVSGPNVARSTDIRLRIVTRDELLAELARREQEYRADFERIVDAQEQVRRQLLTEVDALANRATSEFAAGVAAQERRQRNIAASVNVVRQQFERILTERRINQLGNEQEDSRLESKIVAPLERLAKRELVAAADAIRQLSGAKVAELAGRVDEQQAAILTQMREILANMLQWEGYQEVVSMLRDIIHLQRELKAETQQTTEKQADDVFENE